MQNIRRCHGAGVGAEQRLQRGSGVAADDVQVLVGLRRGLRLRRGRLPDLQPEHIAAAARVSEPRGELDGEGAAGTADVEVEGQAGVGKCRRPRRSHRHALRGLCQRVDVLPKPPPAAFGPPSTVPDPTGSVGAAAALKPSPAAAEPAAPRQQREHQAR